ncbi:hypothetical protein FDC35_05470 [Clostridium botulinum]|nr:hypothetical protein [Clostridium botulinum]NFP00348.1 hypothetical protein [Clostridium botulinum]
MTINEQLGNRGFNAVLNDTTMIHVCQDYYDEHNNLNKLECTANTQEFELIKEYERMHVQLTVNGAKIKSRPEEFNLSKQIFINRIQASTCTDNKIRYNILLSE